MTDNPGPGRPAIHGVRKITRSVRLTPELWQYLATTPSAAETIEQAMRRTQAFRDWQRQQSNHHQESSEGRAICRSGQMTGCLWRS